MREILFRGKRCDNGEWVEGQLLYFRSIVSGNELALIVESCEWDNSNEWFNLCKRAKVIPETVSEFTSLYDKNGKKIFEGDIVAGALHWLEQKKNGVVTFREGSFGLLWYRGEAEHFNPFTSMCNITYEVIGNIHDNPELMRGDAGDA